MTEMEHDSTEELCRQIGEEIFERVGMAAPFIWEKAWWERRTIEWLSEDQEIKSRALRFIDVFPSLKTNRQVVKHLKEYMPTERDRMPRALRMGVGAMDTALLTPGAATAATRLSVNNIAKWFIAGSNLEEISQALERLIKSGMSYTLDMLGEATLSESEADSYMNKYLDMIEYLSSTSAPGDPQVNVSIKLSSLSPNFNPVAPGRASVEVRDRLRQIFRLARDKDALVCVDMESYQVRDLTLQILTDIMDEEEFSDWDGVGTVAQSYLKDSEESLEWLLKWLEERGRKMSIRLVKGAYWEQETVTANQKRWSLPVREIKAQTDTAFERMTKRLLEKSDLVRVGIASHNVRSIAKSIALAREMKTPEDGFEIQMLFGMGNEIKAALVEMDVPLRVYTPVGEPLPGMAYLVRRILENSSNESFLRRSFVEEESRDELMANPSDLIPEQNSKGVEETIELCKAVEGETPVFINEPEPQFFDQTTRDGLHDEIENVGGRLGFHYPAYINGHNVNADNILASINPSNPSQMVGSAPDCTEKMASNAMESAQDQFKRWSGSSSRWRMEILMKAAEIIRQRKWEMASWQIIEVGKTRAEAMADVDEAIDHINNYAIAGYELLQSRSTQGMLGETNQTRYMGRGPAVIISPWNFPLAILAGLATSALASGNTVVIKPSSDAIINAALFVEILRDAGIPDGVVNFVPGHGEVIGPVLLNHSATTSICFTGSYEVGSSIMETAYRVNPQRPGFIKVIAEMGGKNAVIVDESADLDAACTGVIASAFGFGGQKCSACSRVIVLESVYDEFSKRLADVASSLLIGDPKDPAVDFGPLINKNALERAMRYVEIGKGESEAILAPEQIDKDGYFMTPAIFGYVPPESPLAQDEIFAPVLSVLLSMDLDDAIEIANSVNYALTGGIYSRTPSSVLKAREALQVGNMYINREITGAVVERQPFGGFKRSGLGAAKAGAKDLIRELAIPQTISENIIRHGFSPDLDT